MSLKKAKVKGQTLLSRLGGVSAFGFGISFRPAETDRTVVRQLLTVLEDKRALYVGGVWEQPNHVVQSVLQIRTELTNALKHVGEDTPAQAACRLMRGACRDFLQAVGSKPLPEMDHHFAQGAQGEEFLLALGKLRATFGQQVALLAHIYSIDLEVHLSSILPPVPDNS